MRPASERPEIAASRVERIELFPLRVPFRAAACEATVRLASGLGVAIGAATDL